MRKGCLSNSIGNKPLWMTMTTAHQLNQNLKMSTQVSQMKNRKLGCLQHLRAKGPPLFRDRKGYNPTAFQLNPAEPRFLVQPHILLALR